MIPYYKFSQRSYVCSKFKAWNYRGVYTSYETTRTTIGFIPYVHF